MKTHRRIYWLFFLALSLFYVSLTAGTIEGQGYNQENLTAARQVVTNAVNVLTRRPLIPVEWTRHGCLEPLFQLPFVAASRVLFGDSIKWAGRVAVLQPILATSLICLLLLIWCHRLTNSLRRSCVLASAAGMATMLWPYAYIGLETTQSLALIAAAYISLGRERTKSWPEVLAFAAACATALTVKLNGVFLLPAVAFLIFCYFRPLGAPSNSEPSLRDESVAEAKPATARDSGRYVKLAALLAIVAVSYAVNNAAKSHYWSAGDAGAGYYAGLLVDSPLTAALQAFSYFGSPNKSLFLYCPVLVLSFVALGVAYRRQPGIVIFALLALGGVVAGFSIIWMWAEESWGPRYLHVAIAPLMLCLAAAKSSLKFDQRRELPLLGLMILGFAVSLLGSFFTYGALHNATMRTSQSTLDSLQYDPRWNHLRFNLKLMQVWARGNLGGQSQPEPWPPPRHWWFIKPADAPEEITVDLRDFATPQPLLAKGWQPTTLVSPGSYRTLRTLCFLCLALSLATWAMLIRVLRRSDY